MWVELGGYTGYSAINFGQALHDMGSQRHLSLEASLYNAEIARPLKFARLDDFVQVIVGLRLNSLVGFETSDPPRKIDVLF